MSDEIIQKLNELSISVACLIDDRLDCIPVTVGDLENIQDLVTQLENIIIK